MTISIQYMYIQVHNFNPFEERQCEIETLLPHSSVLEENAVGTGWDRSRPRKKKKLSYENELKEHTISIQ